MKNGKHKIISFEKFIDKSELLYTIDCEINWCKNNECFEGELFRQGFIKGLEQTKLFIKEISKIEE